MANRHIKVINGRKYYYESIRVGKKVTSRYLGPVERVRRKKKDSIELEQNIGQQLDSKEMKEGLEELPDDENYIG